ncbi:hypothetical protein MMC13_002430 [Lambiella insularis]|nr:hypothetical protein [Lambiella insularis]
MAATGAETAPRVLVLPKVASKDALILTLAHPRSSLPTRYVFSPQSGIFEFTRIAAPRSSYRSWLMSTKETDLAAVKNLRARQKATPSDTHVDDAQTTQRQCRVARTAEIFAATPLDPLFLILPVLSPDPSTKSTSTKPLFQSCDDHLEKLMSSSKHFRHVLEHASSRRSLEQRLKQVCDVVNGGDEPRYRLSEDKLLQELCVKAKRMTSSGLPPSMEEKFVQKALEVPVVSLKHQTSMVTESSFEADSTHEEVVLTDTHDSQSSIATSATASTNRSESTSMSTPPGSELANVPCAAPPDVVSLLRLRVALTYILTAYVPPRLAATLTQLLEGPTSPVEFGPCDTYLARMAALRAEGLASRSLADFSRKRSMNEDDEEVESRAEKKRRTEEEEKRRKSGQSRAVRELKKVDVTGMKKMSDFFAKGSAIGRKK